MADFDKANKMLNTGFMDGAEKMLDGADSGNTKQMQCFLFLTTTLL